MAVKSESGSAATEAPSMAAPAIEAPAFHSAGAIGGGNMFGLISAFSQGTALGPEIDKYIEDIRTGLNKDGTLIAGSVQVKRLTDPNGAHAFIAGNSAIILIFQDLFSGDLPNFLPASAHITLAYNSLQGFRPDPAQPISAQNCVHLLSAILVGQADFNRSMQMTGYISRSLAVALNAGLNMALNELSDNRRTEFVVDYDTAAAKHFINQYNPHAVQPRVDEGFTVKVKRPRNPATGGGVRALDDSVTFLAVGGYTEFISKLDQATGAFKFFPIFRVTSITSNAPINGIEALALTLATDTFISKGRWKVPYSSFQKGAPNLGNLHPADPKTGLFNCTTAQLRDTYIAQNMFPALLAIDVVEGYARIPSLANWATPDRAGEVRERVSRFLQAAVDPSITPAAIANIEYIGTINDTHGVSEDSRKVDYLGLVAQTGLQDDSARRLLDYYQTPDTRTQIVAAKTGTFRSLYQCTTCILNSAFIGFLGGYVRNNLNIASNSTVPDAVSMDYALAQAAYYTQNGFPTITTGMQGFGNSGYTVQLPTYL